MTRFYKLFPPMTTYFVEPLGGVALLLRQGLVVFDDLSDSLKVGADLRLGTRLLQTIPRGLGIP